MELKKYQRVVISDLSDYLALLPTMSAKEAFTSFWSNKGVPLTTDDYYHDTLPGVPRICVKVPTGGARPLLPQVQSRLYLTAYPKQNQECHGYRCRHFT